MRALFRAFDRARVDYLVISGQATVLYGAAHFSQDLDLWIRPAGANIEAMLRALAAIRARVHKLTPPPSVRNMRRGHGFHFVAPGGLYLDVMGSPPRVGGFADAARRAERMRTPWGILPVVGIEDLVEIKKTNRPEDYDVITRLALIQLNRRGPRALPWALDNIFRAEDLWSVVERHGPHLARRRLGPPTATFVKLWSRGKAPSPRDYSLAGARLALAAAKLQDRGRAYWIPRIHELKRLRRAGMLLDEGTPVGSLVRSPLRD